MRARDIIVPFVTSVAIFATVVFNSCASRERVEGDETVAMDEVPAEGTGETPVETGTEGEFGATGETAPEGGELADGAPTEGEVPPSEGTTDEFSPTAETQPPGEETSPSEPFALGGESEPPPSEQPAGEPPASDTPYLPPTEAAVPPPSDSVASSPVPEETTRAAAFPGNSRAPKIPTQAIQRQGISLNRFYFARKGDTPQKVSTLLYGNKAKAKSLSKWNPGAWKPGKPIFYASPANPDDQEMRSLYQERGLQPGEYAVKRGDWLSRIAQKRLGNVNSWKEIAVVNGIESPDSLEPGQKLAIYPKDLGAAPMGQVSDERAESEAPAVARNEAPAKEAPSAVQAQPAVEAPPSVEEKAPVEAEAAAEGEVAPPPVPEEVPAELPRRRGKKQSGPAMDFARLIEQNLFFIVIGAGVSVLLLALLAVSKRRRAQQGGGEDFTEEGFANPRAKRR